MKTSLFVGFIIFLTSIFFISSTTIAQDNQSSFLNDRGTSIPSSLFGTFIKKGELLVFPSFEYTLDHNLEYQPAQYDLGVDEDFRAKFHGANEQIYIGYGLTHWLALEFEFAYMDVHFEKSSNDNSAIPARIDESGLGDFEGQLRMRLMEENDRRPELFGFLDVTIPSHRNKLLISDSDLDFKPGIGIVRGFSWGTIIFRSDLEYNREASSPDIGETAIEYLRRLSQSGLAYLAIEGGEGGAPDEWLLITGLQWRFTNFVSVKIDNPVGITSKATDWAPQIGLLFTFPVASK